MASGKGLLFFSWGILRGKAPRNSSHASLARTCHMASLTAGKLGKQVSGQAERIVPLSSVTMHFLELVHGLP